MKIKSLKLTNFRRFENLELELHEKLTVLVARNGAGKSSVLDAIATNLGSFLTRLPKVAGMSPRDTDFRVFPDQTKPPYMRIECSSFEGISWDRSEKRDKTKKTAAQIPHAKGLKELHDYVDSIIDAFNEGREFELPILIYYGTGRGVFDIPQRKRGFKKVFSRFDALKGALESRTNFKSFVEYFYSLDDIELKRQKEERSWEFEIPELKAIRKAVNKMLPEFSNPRGTEPAGIAVDWNDGEITKKLRIEQLSDGYRTTLAMVMDIAARMAEANPEMPDPLMTEGIVLIDEVELHLHPGWQQTILLDLMRTFPNVQFIVSSHSPQVVSSVKPESLRVMKWEGEKLDLPDVRFSEGAEAQQVLLDVLGVSSTRVEQLEIVQLLHKYQELVEKDLWDTEEGIKIRSELQSWGGEFEPELTRLDTDIRMKEWERGQQ